MHIDGGAARGMPEVASGVGTVRVEELYLCAAIFCCLDVVERIFLFVRSLDGVELLLRRSGVFTVHTLSVT